MLYTYNTYYTYSTMTPLLEKTSNLEQTSSTMSDLEVKSRRSYFRINNIEIVKDLEDYNPTLKSVLKVEDLFQKQGEFNSRTQLMREMGGSMKIQVLDVILKYLKSLGKVLDNEDGSWTWIFSKNNEKLRNSWEKAEKL